MAEATTIGEAASSEAREQLLAARREAGALREALDASVRAAEEQRGALEARRVRGLGDWLGGRSQGGLRRSPALAQAGLPCRLEGAACL